MSFRDRDSCPPGCKVFVGDLGSNASKGDLEDAFSYYGRLRNVWVARNPPGFAFVEFEDARDAEDSIRGLDGRTVAGRRVKVELSTHGRGGSKRGGGGGSYGGGRGGGDDKCYQCGERGHFARDCRGGGGGGGGGGRDYGSRRGGGRSRSRSRSRSRERPARRASRSRSDSRSRSRSK